ncbi:MAG: IS66 family transposase [Chlamydiota bacterium]
MTTTAQSLDTEQLQKELVLRDQKISYLEEQLAWFKRQIFGKRSEKVIENSEQLLFDAFELPEQDKEEKRTIPAHERRTPKQKGQETITLSPDLPVEIIVLDIPEEKKFCKETGKPLVKIGEEKSQRLAHKPGSYYIKEIIRPKYANPQKPEEGILTAELPDSIISKCRADDSFLAEIITRKFADHLPLYRIAEGMGREGVGISRKLLSQWVVRCGMALKPLYEEMSRKVLEGENIFIDETPVKVLAEKECDTAYLWVVVGGNSSNPSYRIYNFRENRRHDNVLNILKDYRGVLHSDKYGAYQRLAEQKIITWCPCMGHTRRKFFEVESGDLSFRDWVLRKIRYLFMLERVAWARSPEERLQIRQEKEVPIIDELIYKIKERFVDGKLLPKSKFREALGYFCGLIPYVKNYTKYPFARLDNNVAERAIRPIAIGRKNWLFFGSIDGGEAGAILLSLVQTCRGLGINPRTYLEDIFRRLMGHNAQKLEELLPDQWLLTQKNSSK